MFWNNSINLKYIVIEFKFFRIIVEELMLIFKLSVIAKDICHISVKSKEKMIKIYHEK